MPTPCERCHSSGDMPIGHNGKSPCADCNGTGDSDVGLWACETCFGFGKFNEGYIFPAWVLCPACLGTCVKPEFSQHSAFVKDMIQNHKISRSG